MIYDDQQRCAISEKKEIVGIDQTVTNKTLLSDKTIITDTGVLYNSRGDVNRSECDPTVLHYYRDYFEQFGVSLFPLRTLEGNEGKKPLEEGWRTKPLMTRDQLDDYLKQGIVRFGVRNTEKLYQIDLETKSFINSGVMDWGAFDATVKHFRDKIGPTLEVDSMHYGKHFYVFIENKTDLNGLGFALTAGERRLGELRGEGFYVVCPGSKNYSVCLDGGVIPVVEDVSAIGVYRGVERKPTPIHTPETLPPEKYVFNLSDRFPGEYRQKDYPLHPIHWARYFDDVSIKGRTLKARCPNPNHPDLNPSFEVNIDKGLWFCVCGDRKGVHEGTRLVAMKHGFVHGWEDLHPSKDATSEQREQAYARHEYAQSWRLTHPPTYLYDGSEDSPYIPEEIAEHLNKEVTGIKAPKGSGKTSNVIAKRIDLAIKANLKVIVVVSRISLARYYAGKFDLGCATDGDTDHTRGIACCYDSLHKLGINSSKCVLIVDEAESGLLHLFESETMIGKGDEVRRVSAISAFEKFTKNAKQVFLADADLSDVSMNYVLSLRNIASYEKDRFDVLVCTIKTNNYDAYLYEGREGKHSIVSRIVHAAVTGQNLIVACDSRTFATALEVLLTGETEVTKNVDQDELKTLVEFADSDGTSLKLPIDGLLLTQDTKDLPRQREFVQNADAYIEKYKPRYIIYTPTIDCGLSVDTKGHFDMVFGSYCGEVPASQATQALGRLREAVPRYIHVNKYGRLKGSLKAIRMRGWEQSFKVALATTKNYHIIPEVPDQDAAWLAMNELYSDSDTNFVSQTHEERKVEAKENIERNLGLLRELELNPTHIRLAVRQNYSKKYIGESLKIQLQKDGQNVVDVSQQDSDYKTMLSQASETVKGALAIEIAKTPLIERTEAMEIVKRPQRTRKEHLRLMKFRYFENLGATKKVKSLLDDAEFVLNACIQDRGSLLASTILMFGLMRNPMGLAQEYASKFLWALAADELYIPDLVRGKNKTTVEALRPLITLGILNPDKEFTENSVEIKYLMTFIKENMNLVTTGLNYKGFYSRNLSPMKIIAEGFLSRLGLKWGKPRQKGGRGEDRTRVYTLDPKYLDNPYRKQIIECLELKMNDDNETKADVIEEPIFTEEI